MKTISTCLASVCVVILLSTFTAAFADEVGDNLFVTEPKAKPTSVNNSSSANTKVWPCKGYVNAKLLKIIYEELKDVSGAEKVLPPKEQFCEYNISYYKEYQMTIYSVWFYVSEASMRACRDACDEQRFMTFKMAPDGKKLNRNYVVQSTQKRVSRNFCLAMDGTIVERNKPCP
jgi:hypothetical protein